MLFSSLYIGRGWLRLAFVLIGLLGGVCGVQAQQAAPATIRLQPEDLVRGHNGLQRNFFFLPPGIMGENYVGAGFFGQRLRPYLAGNMEALGNLDNYRRQKTLFLIERLVFLGAAGLYGQQVLAGGERQYFNSTQQVAVGVAAASLLTGIFISRNTNLHMQRAVEAYNTDLPSGRRGSLWQRAQPDKLGLQGTPTGRPMLILSWSVR